MKTALLLKESKGNILGVGGGVGGGGYANIYRYFLGYG